jgi:hypothetical protein
MGLDLAVYARLPVPPLLREWSRRDSNPHALSDTSFTAITHAPIDPSEAAEVGFEPTLSRLTVGHSAVKLLRKIVYKATEAGFEPATFRFKVECSSRLSYSATK